MAEIDSLEIKIQSEASSAAQTIDALVGKLNTLSGKLSEIGGKKLNLNFTLSGSAEKSVNRMEKYVENAAKKMSSQLQNVFNLDKGSAKTVQELSEAIAQSVSSVGYPQTADADALVRELQESGSQAKILDESLQQVYQTIRSIGKIKISDKLDADEWKNQYGGLIGVFSKKEGIPIDSVFEELRSQFQGVFGEGSQLAKEFNLDHPIDQFHALNEVARQANETVKVPFESMEQVEQIATESILKMSESIKSAKRVFQESGGMEEKTPDTGRTSSYAKDLLKLAAIDTSKLSNLSAAISELSASMRELNGITVNTAPILQVANTLEQIGKINIGSAKKIGETISAVMAATQSAGGTENASREVTLPSLDTQQMEESAQKVNETLEGVSNEITKISSESMNYNQAALSSVFGEAAADIQNYQDAVAKFGNNAGKIMNNAVNSANGAKKSFSELREKLSRLVVPEIRTDSLDKLQRKLEKEEQKTESLRAKLENGIIMGRITESADDSGFRNLEEQIALSEKNAEGLRAKIEQLSSVRSIPELLASGFKSLGTWLKNFQSALSGVAGIVGKMSNTLTNALKKITSRIGNTTKSFSGLNKSVSLSNISFKKALTTILRYGFGIRSIYFLVNRLRRALVDGFKNLVQYSSETNASVSLLWNSINQLKNATAAAVSPLLNALAPALNYIIQLCVKAANAVNQLISAFLGKSTWTKAKTLTDDYAASLNSTASSASSAADALEDVQKGIRGFDELNNITLPDETDSGSGGAGTSAENMFEEADVESPFIELAAKIKDILSKLFEPIREAWEQEGEYVMSSWKYALDEIWKLVKDIGNDFLTMWQQQETVAIFEDIFHIIGDIGQSIGNIAANFREAWNEADTGLHIFENIRDIFGVIIANIRAAADATVEWTANLDFSPLLTKIMEWTASLVPVFDTLSGILTDFYTQVLLPLGSWVLEQGLPDLLQVFIDFNSKVDWESLRSNLSEFWSHLEPFAETVGEGLIIFIERASGLVADFANSETFVNFLEDLEDWMDSVDPEDVADGIQKLAKAFIALKAASVGLNALVTIANAINAIGTAVGLVGKVLSPVISLFGSLLPVFQGMIAIIGGATLAVTNFFDMWNSGFSWLNEALMAIGIAIAAVGAVLLGVSAPVATVVAAIVAAVATVAIVIHDNWDTIKEKTSEAWETIKSTLGETWETIKAWASEKFEAIKEKIAGAWDTAKEKTTGAWETIKSTLNEKWESIKSNASTKFESIKEKIAGVWNSINSDTSSSWGDVKTTISTAINNIKSNISSGFNSALSTVTSKFNSIKEKISSTINDAKETVRQAIEKIKSYFNFSWKLPDLKLPHISISGSFSLNPPSVPSFSISWYANGGFIPNTFSLIGAGEGGIPELLGSVGGKPAIAGGEEITGIRDAMYDTSNQEIALLRQQNQLLQAILEKDFGITQNQIGQAARNYSQEYLKRTGSPAYAF